MSSKIKSFLHVPLSVLFCALLAAGFFSCAALDSPDDSSCGAVYEIKGILLTEGAFPADLTAAQNSTGLSENARSGSAGIKGSVYYTVKAVNTKTSSEYNGTVSDSSFSVKVPKGSWNILAEGFSDEGKSVQILKGSAEVSVDDDYSAKSGIEVAMSPLTDGAGDILLEIKKTAESGIKSFRARLEKLGGGESVSPESIEINFPSDSDFANFKKEEIDSGTYILHLEFYSKAGCTGNLLFYAQETVNVFKNLTTDTWQGNSSYLSGGKFAVSKETVETFSMTTFFVQGTDGTYTPVAAANDSNSGTYFAPLRTVQAAVDKIESINDGTSSYTVMVDGNFTAEGGDFRSTYKESSTLVEINPSDKLVVTIRSFSSDSVAVLNLNSLGRGFYIGEYASVTLENMEISDGWLQYISGVTDGCGIYCKGNLSLQNCTFRNNRTKHGSGALFFIGGTLKISDGNFVSNKGSSSCGGIYCEGNSSLQNCTFEGNSGRQGGAILFSDGTHLLSGCKFIGNTVSLSNGSDRNPPVNRSNGSALLASGNGELTISDCEFMNNDSEEGSAIDFYSGNFTVTIESGIFSGNKSTGSIDRGAIYVGSENGKLRLGGSVSIEDSESNGIGLASGKTIEIIGKLSPENSDYTARLSIPDSDCTIGRQLLLGSDEYKPTEEDYSKFFISDPTNEGWHINKYGYLTRPVSISMAVANWNEEIYTDIIVSNLEELETFASFVNKGNAMQKSSIKLTEDITINSDSSFKGIGSSTDSDNCPFSGTFDGNGKTIEGKNNLDSIFIKVENGTIKNLKSAGWFNYSGIVKEIDCGVVENCENSAKIYCDNSPAGGIVAGATNSLIRKCRNSGTVQIVYAEYSLNYLGGICGHMRNGGIVSDCMNSGKVRASASPRSTVGGIIGCIDYRGDFLSKEKNNGVFNSINIGGIENSEVDNSPSYTGGIIGELELINNNICNTYIKNCVNMGTIDYDGGHNDYIGNIVCRVYATPEDYYKFIGVSNCYSNKEPFFGANYDDKLGICEVYSFTVLPFNFLTEYPLTVSTVNSRNLVELLNAWVDEQNSSGGTYLKWKYTETTPVNLELVYEN